MSFPDVPVTGQVSTGLLPNQMARSFAPAYMLVKTQMSGPSLPSGASRRARASLLNARLGCVRLGQSGAIQTGCGCHLHTEPLSVSQGRAASWAVSQGQHGPAAPAEVSPEEADASCAGAGGGGHQTFHAKVHRGNILSFGSQGQTLRTKLRNSGVGQPSIDLYEELPK